VHSLLGFLELVAVTDLDDDQQRLISKSVASADSILETSVRLTEFIQFATSEVVPNPQDVEVEEFFEHLSRTLMRGFRVGIVVDEGVPSRVKLDPVLTGRLCSELISNAIRHSGGPVAVQVEAVPDQAQLRIRIRQNPRSLPADFETAIAAGHGVRAGGIGLPLIRRIIGILGGELSVENSEARAELILNLPLIQAKPRLADSRAADGQGGRLPATDGTSQRRIPLSVLLIEDNEVNRLLTQRQMRKLGHLLDVVASGEEGLRVLAQHRYDALLLDRHLQGIDGVEVARRIRASEKAGHVAEPLPVIALTADATAENRAACQAAGMTDFLTKPVDIAALDAALSAVSGKTAELSVEYSVDVESLSALAANLADPDGLAEILDAYVAQLPKYRLSMQAAGKNGNLRKLAGVTQSLRSSSESVGAHAVVVACQKLEGEIREDALEKVMDSVARLTDVCYSTEEELVGIRTGMDRRISWRDLAAR
jgi:CheY-like chemotaxis protein/two-component sensor histidine kinase